MPHRILEPKACDAIASGGSSILSGEQLNRLSAELSSRRPRSRPGRIGAGGYNYPTVQGDGQLIDRRPLGRYDPAAVYIVTKSGIQRLQRQAASSLPAATSFKRANGSNIGQQGGSIAARPQATSGQAGLSKLARQVKSATLFDL